MRIKENGVFRSMTTEEEIAYNLGELVGYEIENEESINDRVSELETIINILTGVESV